MQTQLRSLMSPRWQKRCMRSCSCQGLTQELLLQDWAFISTLLGKEDPTIMQGTLRPQGHCDKNSKALNFLPFPPSFSSDFCCGSCVWRWFNYILRPYTWIGIYFFSCTLVCQEFKISPKALSNMGFSFCKQFWLLLQLRHKNRNYQF